MAGEIHDKEKICVGPSRRRYEKRREGEGSHTETEQFLLAWPVAGRMPLWTPCPIRLQRDKVTLTFCLLRFLLPVA